MKKVSTLELICHDGGIHRDLRLDGTIYVLDINVPSLSYDRWCRPVSLIPSDASILHIQNLYSRVEREEDTSMVLSLHVENRLIELLLRFSLSRCRVCNLHYQISTYR